MQGCLGAIAPAFGGSVGVFLGSVRALLEITSLLKVVLGGHDGIFGLYFRSFGGLDPLERYIFIFRGILHTGT